MKGNVIDVYSGEDFPDEIPGMGNSSPVQDQHGSTHPS